MRNLMFSGVCLLSTALIGCQQQPPANDQLDAVLWTQTSIEHELIYRQIFASATRQLDTALADPTWDALALPPRDLAGLPPAVVVDIDETVLDNVPLNARDILTNQVYSYDRWNTWVDQAKAQALPGAVEFLRAAEQEGHHRLRHHQPRTQPGPGHGQQPAPARLPVAHNEQVLAASTPTGGCEQAGYGQELRDAKSVASHALVLMLAGGFLRRLREAEHNTLADQRKAAAPYLAWLGQRWFLLPNPTYGNWYSAPYGDQENCPSNASASSSNRRCTWKISCQFRRPDALSIGMQTRYPGTR